MSKMEGSKKNFCAICCLYFKNAANGKGAEGFTNQSRDKESNKKNEKVFGQRHGDGPGKQDDCNKILGEFLRVNIPFKQILESLCQDCMKSFRSTMPAMKELMEVEEKVLKLQVTLLEKLKMMNRSLAAVDMELNHLVRSIQHSDVGCLQSMVDSGDITNDVFILRDKVLNASQICAAIRRSLKSKTEADVTPAGGEEPKPCNSGTVGYFTRSRLKGETITKHTKPHAIPMINDENVETSTSSKAQLIKSFTCEYEGCGKSFTTGKGVKIHASRVHPRGIALSRGHVASIFDPHGENGESENNGSNQLTHTLHKNVPLIMNEKSAGTKETRKEKREDPDIKNEHHENDDDVKVDAAEALLGLFQALPNAAEAVVKENEKLKNELWEYNLLQKNRMAEYEKLKSEKIGIEAERNCLKRKLIKNKEEDQQLAAKLAKALADNKVLEEMNEQFVSYLRKHSSDTQTLLEKTLQTQLDKNVT